MYWGRRFIFIAFALFISTELMAQGAPGEFYTRHLKTQNTGMYILGSWAVANIATGVYGWNQYSGDTKYFHQMNVFWNAVNLGIAGLAIHNNMQIDPLTLAFEEALAEARNIEKILLINSGLDVGYIGVGFLLKHLASGSDKRMNLMTGYGNSLILQGSFLLVIDLILYGVLHAQHVNFVEGISLSMGDSYLGFGWNYRF